MEPILVSFICQIFLFDICLLLGFFLYSLSHTVPVDAVRSYSIACLEPYTYLIAPETFSVIFEQRGFKENSLMSSMKDAQLNFLAS